MHNFIEAMYCKAFAPTLKLIAHTWFHQLSSSSISSFAHLSENFKNYFMVSRLPEKDTSYPVTLKQGKNEHFHEYLIRFTKAMYDILSVDTSMAIEAFKQGILHKSVFYLSILKQKIRSFEEIKENVETYIRQSDAFNAQEKNGQPSEKEKPSSQNNSNNKKRDWALS